MIQSRETQQSTSEEAWRHPETLPNEVFLQNMSKIQFEIFGLPSKRRGQVAYDGNGSRLSRGDWFPVFIATQELKRRKNALRDLRRLLR